MDLWHALHSYTHSCLCERDESDQEPTINSLLRHTKNLELGSLLAGLQIVSDQGALGRSVLGLDGTLSLELLLRGCLLGLGKGWLLCAGCLVTAIASDEHHMSALSRILMERAPGKPLPTTIAPPVPWPSVPLAWRARADGDSRKGMMSVAAWRSDSWREGRRSSWFKLCREFKSGLQ